MTTLTRKCHMKALSENLELGLIGGILASVVDTLWVVMDSINNGMHWYYVIILTGLILSSVVLTVALVRHHRANVKQQFSLLYKFKKDIAKRKNKHK